jgi:hypothetical protein
MLHSIRFLGVPLTDVAKNEAVGRSGMFGSRLVAWYVTTYRSNMLTGVQIRPPG